LAMSFRPRYLISSALSSSVQQSKSVDDEGVEISKA